MPFGLKGNYSSFVQRALRHVTELPDVPNKTCILNDGKWDLVGNVLEVDPDVVIFKFTPEELTLLVELFNRLCITTSDPRRSYSLGIQPAFISDFAPKSCLPGLLSLCTKAAAIVQISYPNTTLIQPLFHALTLTGGRKSEFYSHPMVELMAMINQLYGLSYITDPLMLFQLVSISLDTPMPSLLSQGRKLRDTVVNLESLRHIFFTDKFHFLKFQKSKDSNMNMVPINVAFNYLQSYFQY